MKLKALFLLLLSFLIINGCIRWSSEFKTGTPSFSPSDTETLYNKALQAAESAGNTEKIGQAILAFENVLKADPQHYNALSYLSTLHILLGDAYSSKKSKKIDHFRCYQAR